MRLISKSILLPLLISCGVTSAQDSRSNSSLPGEQLQEFIRSIELDIEPYEREIVRFLEMESTTSTLAVLAQTANQNPYEPTAIRNEFLLKLENNQPVEQIAQTIQQLQFSVIDTYPEIGVILVRMRDEVSVENNSISNLDAFRYIDSTNSNASDQARLFESFDAFEAATPNLLLSFYPSPVESSLVNSGGQLPQDADWGQTDVNAHVLWQLIDSSDNFQIGVIDGGFAEHEDILLKQAFPNQDLPVHNHGNHVAGIACAQHNNVGINGILPNCEVIAATSTYSLDEIERGKSVGTSNMIVEMAKYVATILRFVYQNPDVGVINLSISYNWAKTFRTNPEQPKQAKLRADIQSQAIIFLSILDIAEDLGIFVVSAAGNDSEIFRRGMSAKYSSPLNYAIATRTDEFGWANGLIVGAYNNTGDRAQFSNPGASIYAPGVDIYSSISTSRNAYKTKSGSSMAAPFVSGAVAALKHLFPSSTNRQIYACLSSSPLSQASIPKLNLQYAIDCMSN